MSITQQSDSPRYIAHGDSEIIEIGIASPEHSDAGSDDSRSSADIFIDENQQGSHSSDEGDNICQDEPQLADDEESGSSVSPGGSPRYASYECFSPRSQKLSYRFKNVDSIRETKDKFKLFFDMPTSCSAKDISVSLKPCVAIREKRREEGVKTPFLSVPSTSQPSPLSQPNSWMMTIRVSYFSPRISVSHSSPVSQFSRSTEIPENVNIHAISASLKELVKVEGFNFNAKKLYVELPKIHTSTASSQKP